MGFSFFGADFLVEPSLCIGEVMVKVVLEGEEEEKGGETKHYSGAFNGVFVFYGSMEALKALKGGCCFLFFFFFLFSTAKTKLSCHCLELMEHSLGFSFSSLCGILLGCWVLWWKHKGEYGAKEERMGHGY
ncbi:hypothetical protein QBC38DRAFT_75750 [Podospora fimiseda]|uniref:Transmembrane protein n=1 Tax=Podospora fimiseda TaxID=252190 RepID=A0AAN6YT41_9PEZI|nr:hypothetical protein QBC38DRAFT_75750 [Podospora fimiseda]